MPIRPAAGARLDLLAGPLLPLQPRLWRPARHDAAGRLPPGQRAQRRLADERRRRGAGHRRLRRSRSAGRDPPLHRAHRPAAPARAVGLRRLEDGAQRRGGGARARAAPARRGLGVSALWVYDQLELDTNSGWNSAMGYPEGEYADLPGLVDDLHEQGSKCSATSTPSSSPADLAPTRGSPRAIS